MCTREQALSIALRYLGEQYSGELKVVDGLPAGETFYKTPEINDCWSIAVPPHSLIVGAGRYILISKKTGRIIFDGQVSE